MSENKRTIEQISEEYSKGAHRAGHVQYQIFALQKDLAMINQSLQDLNVEAAQLKQAEATKEEQPKQDGAV